MTPLTSQVAQNPASSKHLQDRPRGEHCPGVPFPSSPQARPLASWVESRRQRGLGQHGAPVCRGFLWGKASRSLGALPWWSPRGMPAARPLFPVPRQPAPPGHLTHWACLWVCSPGGRATDTCPGYSWTAPSRAARSPSRSKEHAQINQDPMIGLLFSHLATVQRAHPRRHMVRISCHSRIQPRCLVHCGPAALNSTTQHRSQARVNTTRTAGPSRAPRRLCRAAAGRGAPGAFLLPWPLWNKQGGWAPGQRLTLGEITPFRLYVSSSSLGLPSGGLRKFPDPRPNCCWWTLCLWVVGID